MTSVATKPFTRIERVDLLWIPWFSGQPVMSVGVDEASEAERHLRAVHGVTHRIPVYVDDTLLATYPGTDKLNGWVQLLRGHAADWPTDSEAYRRRMFQADLLAGHDGEPDGLVRATWELRRYARDLLDLANCIDGIGIDR